VNTIDRSIKYLRETKVYAPSNYKAVSTKQAWGKGRKAGFYEGVLWSEEHSRLALLFQTKAFLREHTNAAGCSWDFPAWLDKQIAQEEVE
jgi:hypothetical protein